MKGVTIMINLTINSKVLQVELENNSSAQALMELLKKGPIEISMNDYAGMEKVGNLPTKLPRNDKPINVGWGDVILYQGRAFVIYYEHNSWNFTKLGKIVNISRDALTSILGRGSLIATLSL